MIIKNAAQHGRRARALLRAFSTIAFASSSAACTVVGDGGPLVGVYAGLVGVRSSSPDVESVSRADISVLGLWLDKDGTPRGQGGGLGWRRARWVAVAPDCRLVIIVKSQEQLSAAEAFLSRMSDKERSCAVNP